MDYINNVCDGLDPYVIDCCKDFLPTNVTYFDLVNYLIFQTHSYTNEQFRAYKSLDAYKTFESGWVQEMGSKKINTGVIVRAKVKHSQKLNLPPVVCWCKIDFQRIVEYGHCNCLAGLGECCSHVGALLFALEKWNRKFSELEEGTSCTDILASWVQPPMKKIKMEKVRDIKFKTSKRYYGVLMEPFTNAEIDHLLTNLQSCGKSSAIMTIRPPFNEKFKPERNNLEVENIVEDNKIRSLYLQSIYRIDLTNSPLDELLELGKTIKLSYSDEDIVLVEKITKNQAKSEFWYKMRTGRITASKFKQVARTSITKPSISLIMDICFPKVNAYVTKEMKYGTISEPKAKLDYIKNQKQCHTEFQVTEKGLCLNNKYPHIGASPDGYIYCSCCSYGVLEIKCPYRGKNSLSEYLAKKDAPLIIDDDGNYKMKTTHAYYYQLQMQIYTLECMYRDFMLWNETENIIVRIDKDPVFWNKEYPKTITYFDNILLPELLGCFFSKNIKKKINE